MTERKRHQFNLIKAQKWLDKFNRHFSGSKASPRQRMMRQVTGETTSSPIQISAYTNLTLVTTLSTEESKVLEAFDKLVLTSKNDLDSKLNLFRDHRMLKDTVYTINAKNGLSHILTKIDLLNDEKKIFEAAQTQLKSVTHAREDLPELLKNIEKNKEILKNEWEIPSVNLKLYSEKELDQLVTKLAQEIEALETERDKINAQTMISFEFSIESCKLLGIHFEKKN
jgi:uncharacterized small protein (DUF1192 family)